MREPPCTTHRAERASRCRRRAAVGHHAAASAAAQPSRPQERQRGVGKGSAASQAAAPRVSRHGDRPLSGSDRTNDDTRNARAALHYVTRRESEPFPRKSGGRLSRRCERGGTTKPALGAQVLRRRKRCRERRATTTAYTEEANAPTTTRREREQPRTTHRAEGASRRHERAAAKRHAAASVAARPSRRQERPRGARMGSAAPQAAALRVSRHGDCPQSGSDRANDQTTRGIREPPCTT